MDQIIYKLSIEDVQNVASEELDEKLSLEEIKSIEELIAKRIDGTVHLLMQLTN